MDTLEFIDMKTTDDELMAAILAASKSRCVWNGFVWNDLSLRQKIRFVPMAVDLLKTRTINAKGVELAPAWIDRDMAP